MQQDAICSRYCGRHAQRLAGKTAFAKEISNTQDSQGSFFSAFRYNGQLNFAGLDKKSPSLESPCAKIVLFFSRDNISRPFPILERKVWGLNPGVFLAGIIGYA